MVDCIDIVEQESPTTKCSGASYVRLRRRCGFAVLVFPAKEPDDRRAECGELRRAVLSSVAVLDDELIRLAIVVYPPVVVLPDLPSKNVVVNALDLAVSLDEHGKTLARNDMHMQMSLSTGGGLTDFCTVRFLFGILTDDHGSVRIATDYTNTEYYERHSTRTH